MLNHQDRLFNLLDGMEMTKSEHDWLELRFANMTEKERLLFTGALELERPTQADRVMELANQLPCFNLYYGAGDDEVLGRFVLENLERPSPEAVPFLNAEQVGAAYREQDKGISARVTIYGSLPSRSPCRKHLSSFSRRSGTMPSGSDWPAEKIWMACG